VCVCARALNLPTHSLACPFALQADLTAKSKAGEEIDMLKYQPLLSGQAAGAVMEVLPAKEIIESMVTQAIQILKHNTALIGRPPANPRPTYRHAAAKL